MLPPGSRAFNNGQRHNPGGLRVPGTTRFQTFSSEGEGVAAQERLLRNHYLQNGNTVRGVVERYAPRRSRGGDNPDANVNNYIAHVAGRLGISPDDRIDQRHTQMLAEAMREFETGRRRR